MMPNSSADFPSSPLQISSSTKTVVALIILIGLIVRVFLAAKTPFVGDECATIIFICKPFKYILTHFQLWLTMNVFIAVEKAVASVLGEGLIAMRLISILAGIGSLFLIPLLSIRLFPRVPVWIPTLLAAINPYFINFSIEARAYSLTILFSSLLFFLYLHWRENASRFNSIVISLNCFFLIIFHLNGVFNIIWLVAVIALELFLSRTETNKFKAKLIGLKRLFIPFICCMGTAGLYYGLLLKQIMKHNKDMPLYSLDGINYAKHVPAAFSRFFGDMPHFWDVPTPFCWFMAVLLGTGCVHAFFRERFKLLLFCLWILVPFITVFLLGYSLPADQLARYFIFVLPLIIIFISNGIWCSITLINGKIRFVLFALLIILIVCVESRVVYGRLNYVKSIPYHKLSDYISSHVREGDRIINSGFLLLFHMIPYLNCSEREPCMETPVIDKNFLEHFNNNDHPRTLFFVTILDDLHFMDVEQISFGNLKVYVIPPESRNSRLSRLQADFYQASTQIDAENLQGKDCFIYKSLMELSETAGDPEAEKQYQDLFSECNKITMEKFLKRVKR